MTIVVDCRYRPNFISFATILTKPIDARVETRTWLVRNDEGRYYLSGRSSAGRAGAGRCGCGAALGG
jgi:hypothetical protein